MQGVLNVDDVIKRGRDLDNSEQLDKILQTGDNDSKCSAIVQGKDSSTKLLYFIEASYDFSVSTLKIHIFSLFPLF